MTYDEHITEFKLPTQHINQLKRRTYESEEKLCVGGEAVESDEKPLNPTRSLSIRGEGVESEEKASNRRRTL
ncbi:hypothetical protein Bca4012_078505 [Brassica carinata]